MPTETRARAAMKEPLERNDENLEIRDDGQNVSSADQLGHQDILLQEELLEASRGQEASRGDSYFQREILKTVNEQRVLMMDYKETHDRQLFELTGELKRLSLNFSRLCDKNNELEQNFDLHAKIGQLETTNKLNQERLVAVHAGILASSQEIIKTELRGEFSTAFEEFPTEILHEKKSTRERLERSEIKRKISTSDGKSQATIAFRSPEHDCTVVNTAKAPSPSRIATSVPVQHLYSTAVPSTVQQSATSRLFMPVTTPIAQTTEITIIPQPQLGATRPIQKPATFDGRIPWDSYRTQFKIVAGINRWSEGEKAAFLALTVLSNLSPEHRNHYPPLVAALESRYGSRRQAELHRMKLRM
ncbi:Hypothetical predicted protein [Paramuricea clavata]|uniref:Uncharacterized protein n=1 Tax=Paramuricea clavata TaxID=317549 RepID=A0A7D9DJK3_PARCT|nr:Hypothetical predicted protein [Paramuricea clavata]